MRTKKALEEAVKRMKLIREAAKRIADEEKRKAIEKRGARGG